MRRFTGTSLPALAAAVLLLAGCNSVASSHQAPKHVKKNAESASKKRPSLNSVSGSIATQQNKSSSASNTTLELQASNAWPAVVNSLPLTENVVSPISIATAGVYRAIAYNCTTTSASGLPTQGELTVDVYKFVQGEWYSVANVQYATLPPLGGGTVGNGIVPAYLISANRPAYLVTIQGASNPFNSVVGKIPGQGWSKIGFMTPQVPGLPANDGFASVVQDGQLVDGGHEIQTSVDNCTPDCAQGANYLITYVFSSATSAFIALNAPVVANNT